MSMDSGINVFDQAFIIQLLHGGLFILLVLYAIFAILIVKQVSIMSSTLITPVSPLVKAIAIVHAGVAVGLIILAVGFLS